MNQVKQQTANKFSHNLSRILKEKNVSQSKLAFWTDLSESLIFRYVNSERCPSLSALVRIANALNVEPTDLLDIDTISKTTIGDISTLSNTDRETLENLLISVDRKIPLVKELRVQSGLSQKDFADKYGVSIQSIRDWEAGTTVPAEYTLNLLARAVNQDFPN